MISPDHGLFAELPFGYDEVSSCPDLSDFMPEQFPLPDMAGESENIFSERKRKAWRSEATDLARCDFQPGRAQMILRGSFRSISLWRRSVKGMALAEIKESPEMVPFFISNMAAFISSVIGGNLRPQDFALVAPPKRRHKIRNFASTVAQGIAAELGIPFHDDFAQCRNRQRVGAVFTADFTPPEHNIIVFDDFVTSGSTLQSMKVLLDSLGRILCFSLQYSIRNDRFFRYRTPVAQHPSGCSLSRRGGRTVSPYRRQRTALPRHAP